MSNTELLTTAYVGAHRAADISSRLWNAAHQNEAVLATDAKGDISELRKRLQSALCAAQELENRANGMAPAKVG